MYITIDGGTTNTRVSLVQDKNITETVKLSIGARNGIDGNEPLKAEIKKAIEYLMDKYNISQKDIKRILASGMITSEYGLCNLNHITAPAGIGELHNSIFDTELKEISEIPFSFVRGVKSVSNELAQTDMMRGEETELMGLMEQDSANCMYILPGSHSKIIFVDENKKISRFTTMLTGEMVAALSQNTILKQAVDLSCEETDAGYLLHGYDYAEENGLNEALFKVRILKNLFNATEIQTYSFFMGAVLHAEIKKILTFDADKIIIGGRYQIKRAMTEILNKKSNKKIIELDEKTVDNSSVFGMIKIYENKI